MTSLQALEFDNAALSAAIAAVDLACIDRRTSDELSLAFGRQADSSADLDAPLKFLAIICSWRLRPDEEESPFEPVWRLVTIDDLTDAQLSAMASVAESVADPELRARFYDLLWMRRRRHDLARLAAEDYLASAERLVRSRHMIGMKERLHRAVQLAAMLGRSQELFSRIVDGIMRLAQTPDLPYVAVAECLRVFHSERSGTPASLYNLAHAHAQSIAANERNPLWERTFWELAADVAWYADDQASSRTARINAALTYEREAQAAPLQAVAAHFWQMALRTYRTIPDTEDARRRVHERLLSAQQQIPKEMVPLHTDPIDISDYVARSRDRIRNKTKPRAVVELIFATQWLPKAYLRDQAQKSITCYPLQHLFASVRFGSTGKVAATAPAGHPNPDEIVDERMKAEMCQQYRFHIPVAVAQNIEPMREELLYGHCITLDDIAHVVHGSPIVPPGREPFFTIGIHAGMHGRFLDALHVLIPQLEHVLRYHHAADGTITSTIDQCGIQQEFDLNRLLAMPESETMLGEDLCFTLRTLFTERHGYNFRNELSHGMLAPSALYSQPAIFARWLILRLVAGAYAQAIIAHEDAAARQTGTDSEEDSGAPAAR